MDYQRKILGLLYIIGGSIFILIMSLTITFIFAFPLDIYAPQAVVIPEFVKLVTLTGCLFLLLILGIPSLIISVALMKGKKWAFDWVLVIGCFYLIFFPLGTAIGIYALIVFFGNRNNRSKERNPALSNAVQ